MYEIEIGGKKFNYDIYSDYNEYDGTYHWTEFYKTIMVNEKKWSWRKFRFISTSNMVEKKIKLFTIGFDIHNPNYTKSDIRKKLEREVELLGRAEEIERGEIV
jgi:hypothetical protein